MLAEAARQGCYAALHEADLLDFLPRHPAAWDLIAAADVLNYLGDLGPALAALRAALRPGGLALFSVELAEGRRAGRGPTRSAPGCATATPCRRCAPPAPPPARPAWRSGGTCCARSRARRSTGC
ncbi:class I SAM-dependent methyltransferase [Teichococcus aestuarii]|uniref:hypothetical protein n=1 Tax=Teichococcus aestuarii TaxID=568898 RepID=UPI00360C3E9D